VVDGACSSWHGVAVAELPDAAVNGRPRAGGPLDRVGMTGIETLVTLPSAGGPLRVPALVDAFVSLDVMSLLGGRVESHGSLPAQIT
jgi:hypothetical protein